MKASNVYSKKISSEEAQEGFILIFKNKLSFFSSVGSTFDLVKDNLCKRVKVEAVHCTCRGLNLPHEHYFIRWSELKAGDNIEIEKDPKKDDRYILKICRI